MDYHIEKIVECCSLKPWRLRLNIRVAISAIDRVNIGHLRLQNTVVVTTDLLGWELRFKQLDDAGVYRLNVPADILGDDVVSAIGRALGHMQDRLNEARTSQPQLVQTLNRRVIREARSVTAQALQQGQLRTPSC